MFSPDLDKVIDTLLMEFSLCLSFCLLDLDFLVPKAGFFCPICSLFYSGEKAMANHCKSTRHKQNTEVTHTNLQVLSPSFDLK
jgi:hypothetical protein